MKKLVTNSIEKLLKLQTLCYDTDKMYEEKQGEDKNVPFSEDLIKLQGYLAQLEDWTSEAKYEDELILNTRQRQTLAEMMFRCNEMWRTRKAVMNGDLEISSLDNTDLDMKLLVFIKDNQKINAIKEYRRIMKERYRIEKTLKESKEYVDALAQRFERQAGEHKAI